MGPIRTRNYRQVFHKSDICDLLFFVMPFYILPGLHSTDSDHSSCQHRFYYINICSFHFYQQLYKLMFLVLLCKLGSIHSQVALKL